MTNNRQSNIELLRILAMFMVVSVHAWAQGAEAWPLSVDNIRIDTKDSALTLLQESFFVGCSNIFILISGWFGIHARLKNVCSFLFQVFFFSIFIYIIMLISGELNCSSLGCFIKQFRDCLFLRGVNWFILSYFLLMLLSPMINTFIQNVSQEKMLYTICAYYFFIFYFDFIGDNSFALINKGYSVLSFIGLYLISRYIAIYKPKFSKLGIKIDIIIYFASSLLLYFLSIIPPLVFREDSIIKIYSIIYNKLFALDSPVVIIKSIALFIIFTKFKFQNRVINWFAISCFSILLIHTNPLLRPTFTNLSRELRIALSIWSYSLVIIGYILAWLFISVIIDQIRKYLWNRLSLLHFNDYKYNNIV